MIDILRTADLLLSSSVLYCCVVRDQGRWVRVIHFWTSFRTRVCSVKSSAHMQAALKLRQFLSGGESVCNHCNGRRGRRVALYVWNLCLMFPSMLWHSWCICLQKGHLTHKNILPLIYEGSLLEQLVEEDWDLTIIKVAIRRHNGHSICEVIVW